MSNPIAVLISDVHYNINTLELADAAMRQAISKANALSVPMVVAGDIHDTKANLRGECVNRMLETFETCKTACYVLVGNHDLINEKSKAHSLNFLRNIPNVHIIDVPQYVQEVDAFLVPYQADLEFLQDYLTQRAANGRTNRVIMHQGITTADPGEYTHDKTAISTEYLKDLRVISGHYHARQDIKCGRPQKGCVGLTSYIGNPYTLGFGEANHPSKGYQILNADGTLTHVATRLSRHIVLNVDKVQITGKVPIDDIRSIDIVKVKYTGTKEELSKVDKEKLGKELGLTNFKLEFIPTESSLPVMAVTTTNKEQILDELICRLSTSDEQKERLKTLWRTLCE